MRIRFIGNETQNIEIAEAISVWYDKDGMNFMNADNDYFYCGEIGYAEYKKISLSLNQYGYIDLSEYTFKEGTIEYDTEGFMKDLPEHTLDDAENDTDECDATANNKHNIFRYMLNGVIVVAVFLLWAAISAFFFFMIVHNLLDTMNIFKIVLGAIGLCITIGVPIGFMVGDGTGS